MYSMYTVYMQLMWRMNVFDIKKCPHVTNVLISIVEGYQVVMQINEIRLELGSRDNKIICLQNNAEA